MKPSDITYLTRRLHKKDVSPEEAESVFKSCFDFVNGKKYLKEPLAEWFSVLFDAVSKGRRGNFIMSVPLRFDFSLLGLNPSAVSLIPYSYRISEIAGDIRTIGKIAPNSCKMFHKDGRTIVFFDRAGEFVYSCKRPPFTEVRHEGAEELCARAMSFKDDHSLKMYAIMEFIKGGGFFAEQTCQPEERKIFVHPDIKDYVISALDMPKKELEKSLYSFALAFRPVDGITVSPRLHENGDTVYYNDGRFLYIFSKENMKKALVWALEPEEIMR